MPARGLVLAGGGLTGIAWELGMVTGLARLGVELAGADLVVGTSAGSVVGAQITSGCPLESLLERQLDPGGGGEIAADFDAESFRTQMAEIVAGASGPEDARARIGRWALEAETVPEEVRRAVIAGRLPVEHWPERDLVVTAVDAESGDLRTFDRHCGVDLVDAVAASCAVPGVWPPVTIGGRRYVDGGIRSGTNADLAASCGRVLVLVPFSLDAVLRERIGTELGGLAEGSSLVVEADAATVAAIGSGHLDPARRPAAARAGLAQARRVAAAVGAFWDDRLSLSSS